MFHEQLSAEGKRWRDIAPPDARERVGKIATVLASNYRDGLLRTDERSRFTARVLAESLQDFVETLVTWMRGQYEFDPAVAELEFGFGAGGAPAWEIDLGAGHKLALRGRIDRIDLCRETGDRALCVVMDYKSGQRKLDKILVEHGVQLQLLAYLAVVRSWPPEVWAGLNLPAFFSLSFPEEEKAGVRSLIVSKSNPIAPALPMNLLGAPASRRPVGSRNPELAGETPALPGISSPSNDESGTGVREKVIYFLCHPRNLH